MKIIDLLGIPAFYSRISGFLGGNARVTYVREHVRPASSARILDIGCGPGDILVDLPRGAEYIGIDASPKYIESARRRFGTRGSFQCTHVTRDLVGRFKGFDIVMANGVLHHLDDRAATDLLVIAREALAPGGRVVTLDGCYIRGQSKLAKFFLAHDRGQFVRTQADYERLAKEIFRSVETRIRNDLMRIPYTHIILECRA